MRPATATTNSAEWIRFFTESMSRFLSRLVVRFGDLAALAEPLHDCRATSRGSDWFVRVPQYLCPIANQSEPRLVARQSWSGSVSAYLKRQPCSNLKLARARSFHRLDI